MQTWAKRGIQTALVTGGMLMLGTGIASADEDVNPDGPASPLDTTQTTALGRDVDLNTIDDATRDIPVLGQVGDWMAGDGVTESVNQAVTDTAEGIAQDVVAGLTQQDGTAPAPPPAQDDVDTAALPSAADAIPEHTGDEPFTLNQATGWVAPIRVDSGSIGLTGQEAQADGVVGDNRYGLTTDLTSVREIADLGHLPARLHQAGADLSGTGDGLGEELLDISGGLIEASQNQTQQTGPGLLTGDLTVVPDGQGATRNTAGDQPADTGEGGAVVQGLATQVADRFPVFDVPADVLSRALSRISKLSPPDVADGSHINLPLNRLETVPTQLPTLLPLGRSLQRDEAPVTDPVDDLAGVFSGVLANLTDQLSADRTLPAQQRDQPQLNVTNPFGPISGDLFEVESLPIVGDLFTLAQTAQSTGLLPQRPLDQQETTELPAVLPAPAADTAPAAPARTAPLPAVEDLDVTQILPALPSLSDLRAPSLRAMPAMAGFPVVDPSTLTDTRAALASLFNRPIG